MAKKDSGQATAMGDGARHNINPALVAAGLAVAVSDLVELDRNPRAHSDRSIEAIAASFAAFMQNKPLVYDADTKRVIAGNGGLRAARDTLGWTHVAAIPASGLSEAQKRGYALADNRTAEVSSWNYEYLHDELVALRNDGYELSNLGWEDYELEPLLQAEFVPPEPTDGATERNAIPEGLVNVALPADVYAVLQEARTLLEAELLLDQPDDVAAVLACARFVIDRQVDAT